MTWTKTAADRQRDSQVYGPEWRRARQRALDRSGHRCSQCRSPRELQVDHVIPVSRGGTHDQSNLAVLCVRCHRKKTAQEGGGYRSTRTAADADFAPTLSRWSDPEPKPSTLW